VDKRENFTIADAAKRVHRSKRTIQAWMNRDGMRFHWKGGRKIIRLEDLLLHYRTNLTARRSNSPEHRRKLLAEKVDTGVASPHR
jgi:hypothetical protein